jgi:predicted AAA+ superfamily ATPase
LTADARGSDTSFKEETAAEYYDALTRLMFIDDLPAWSPHIRSAAALRKAPKRHLADPSLAGGALRLTVPRLRADLEYLGLLFESAVVHDLRLFAEVHGGDLYHYRDSRGRELDAVMVVPLGTLTPERPGPATKAASDGRRQCISYSSRYVNVCGYPIR